MSIRKCVNTIRMGVKYKKKIKKSNIISKMLMVCKICI